MNDEDNLQQASFWQLGMQYDILLLLHLNVHKIWCKVKMHHLFQIYDKY